MDSYRNKDSDFTDNEQSIESTFIFENNEDEYVYVKNQKKTLTKNLSLDSTDNVRSSGSIIVLDDTCNEASKSKKESSNKKLIKTLSLKIEKDLKFE